MVTRKTNTTSTTGAARAAGSKAANLAGQMAQKLASQMTPENAVKTAKGVQKDVTRAVTGTLGLSGERMSKVDTAWLRMDSPSNLMMIVGVWQLSPGVDYDVLCQRIEERLLKYNRFRQRVVQDTAGATWVEDRNFDITAHVVRETLPKSKGVDQQTALQDRVGELAMQPLDKRRPLWQLHLIENYVGPDGKKGSALVVRIHHCIADGISLISVTMSLIDGGLPPPERKRHPAAETGAANAEDWIADKMVKPFTSLTVKALGLLGDRAAQSLGLLRDPQAMSDQMDKSMSSTMDAARMAYQVLSDAASLALMPDDSKTRLKGKPGTAKRVAWCQPLPLDEVKAVSKALGCSINDVLLSCVAGAIGAYLKSFGDDVTGKEIRAMVPVNLRPLDQAYKLGNKFGLAPLVLPIGMDNPVERVFEVRRRMNALKGSTQPLLAFGVLAVAGMLVKPAQAVMLNMFGKKTTAVMTNVPGPATKLQFCGSTLEQSLFWVPQSGDVGLGVSILSYGGGVQFGVITDTVLCPEPQKIIDEFEPEFLKLSWITLMLPWEGEAG